MARRAGRRWLLWGAGVALAYVAAWLSAATAPAILLDGLLPGEPYRRARHPWSPFSFGQPALSGVASLPMETGGSAPGSVPTADGQAVVVVPRGGFPGQSGGASVVITIAPLHLRSVPPPPPGTVFDGNAYRVEARYDPSGSPAAPVRRLTLVLSYPVHAEEVMWLDGGVWTPLPTTVFPVVQKLFAEPAALGTFVAASPAGRFHRPQPWWPYAAAGGAVVAAAAAAWWAAARLRGLTAEDRP
jgi:hypothetical protein